MFKQRLVQTELPSFSQCASSLVNTAAAVCVCSPCALQLAAARKEAVHRQDAAAAALRSASEQHAQELRAVEQRAAAAEQEAGAVQEEVAALREKRVKEMDEIESRFRELVETKNGTIASLTQQLQELHAAVS